MSTSSARCDSLMNTRAGRVHRPQRDHAFLDAELAHERHHRVGQVHQLDALGGVDVDVFRDHGEAAGAIAEVVFATGVSRTVTTELLLIPPL